MEVSSTPHKNVVLRGIGKETFTQIPEQSSPRVLGFRFKLLSGISLTPEEGAEEYWLVFGLDEENRHKQLTYEARGIATDKEYKRLTSEFDETN